MLRKLIFAFFILLITMPVLNAQVVRDRDGNSYHTVKIGNQVWMSENLRVSHYRNGDRIQNVTQKEKWESMRSGAWCFYQNSKSNDSIYGKLYNWYAVNDARGLCPKGWHIPKESEWQKLSDALGGDSIAGRNMKQAGMWKGAEANTTSNAFAALPAGSSNCCGFFYLNQFAYFWSADEQDSIQANYRFIGTASPQLRKFSMNKNYGYSCRCVQDE